MYLTIGIFANYSHTSIPISILRRRSRMKFFLCDGRYEKCFAINIKHRRNGAGSAKAAILANIEVDPGSDRKIKQG